MMPDRPAVPIDTEEHDDGSDITDRELDADYDDLKDK